VRLARRLDVDDVDLVAAVRGLVDWKMSFLPSADQYASAFSPAKVSWRTFARCFSPGQWRAVSVPSYGFVRRAGALSAAGAAAGAISVEGERDESQAGRARRTNAGRRRRSASRVMVGP